MSLQQNTGSKIINPAPSIVVQLAPIWVLYILDTHQGRILFTHVMWCNSKLELVRT